MTENQLREEIVRVGRTLFGRGYVHATAGNISVRLPDGGFLITPTDASLGHLDPARLARLDAGLQHTGGDRASKTIALHARIYEAAGRVAATAGTRCVIHTHSTHCVALTLDAREDEELLPPITPYFVMKVGHVPRIPYHRPGAPEAADAVARAIARYGERGTPIRAVMLARLGPNVWHESPAAAMAVLEELEETAKLWWMSRDRPQGAPAPLDPSQIEDLRRQFGAHW